MTLYSDYVGHGRRNVLFNGNFDSWPEGLTNTANSHRALMVVFSQSPGSVICTAEGTTSSKPDNLSQYTYKLQVTTADASVTGAEYVHTFYKIEGFDFEQFVGKTATFSFWVRSSVTGTYSCYFRNGGADRSYVADFTINTADTWEKQEITLKFDYSGGTWDYGNGNGLSVGFAPSCGSTYKTSPGQWATGNYIASSNQITNWGATVGNTFYLAQMQLELGSNATPLERIPWGEFEDLVNRYYATNYLYLNGTQVITGTGRGYASWDFPTHMRANPTVTHPGTNQMWKGTWVASTSVTHSANTYRCLTIMSDGTSGYVVGTTVLMLMTSVICDARL